MNASAARLTDTELDRLEEFLNAGIFREQAMPIDMLQGLLCAVASSPDAIPQERWMEEALGEAPQFEDEAQSAAFTALLMRFQEQIHAELAAGEGLTFYVFPGEDGEDDLATWCDGYLAGMELSDVNWYAFGEEKVVEELLVPFILLSGRMRQAAEDDGVELPSEDEERELMQAARAALPDAVLDLYRYWLERRARGTQG